MQPRAVNCTDNILAIAYNPIYAERHVLAKHR